MLSHLVDFDPVIKLQVGDQGRIRFWVKDTKIKHMVDIIKMPTIYMMQCVCSIIHIFKKKNVIIFKTIIAAAMFLKPLLRARVNNSILHDLNT